MKHFIFPLILIAAPAFAQTQTPGEVFMANWDSNADGVVTLDEATSHRTDMFAAFDADGNGVLAADELAAMDEMRSAMQETAQADQPMPGMGKGKKRGMMAGLGQGFMMTGMDANGDGQVSAAEFDAGTPVWFAKRDRNGDGTITGADFGPTP